MVSKCVVDKNNPWLGQVLNISFSFNGCCLLILLFIFGSFMMSITEAYSGPCPISMILFYSGNN